MKALFIIAAINGFLAVPLGAFGAHGLEGKISESAIATWEKALMFHTVSILAFAIMMFKYDAGSLLAAGSLFLFGITLCGGSLYIYSTTGVKALAMITLFGGVFFLIGRVVLGYALIKLLWCNHLK